MLKYSIYALVFISTISCTSALKKKCQETNWFQYGHDVAMKGKRLTGDEFSAQCEKEGVSPNSAEMDLGFKAGMQEYCKPDVVYTTGKNGEFFNDEFCEPNQLRALKARHAEGVMEFCQEDNGYSFGATGKKYNNVCPKKMEKTFLVRYRAGRKSYLANEVLRREKQISDIDADIAGYDRDRSRIMQQLSMLNAQPPRQELITKTNPDGSHSTELRTVEDPSVASQKTDLKNQIESIDRKIDRSRQAQKSLRDEIFEFKKENNTLEP